MKKFFPPILFILLTVLFFNPLVAQKYVSTQPEKKNAVMELFTGVRDAYSYAGNEKIYKMSISNPANIFMIAYHPSNANYTLAYGGDESLRREWPSNFFTKGFCGMNGPDDLPVAMVNRRQYSGVRARKKDTWKNDANAILSESSPCNAGFLGTYDDKAKLLTIDVEVYFTATVTDKYYIYTVLTEDSVVTRQAWQYGFGEIEKYPHKRVFRDSIIPGAWGDPINEATTQGSLVTRKYTFDNNVSQYNMEHCSVMVFIRNGANEEIVTGWGNKAHTDRLVFSSAQPAFAAIPAGTAKTRVFTLRNNSDIEGNLQFTVSKSLRTPADWTVEYSTASSKVKSTDKILTDNVKLGPGDSVDITLKINAGTTVGVGDAQLTIVAGNIFGEIVDMKFSAVSNSVEYLEVMERPSESEPNSLAPIIEGAARDAMLKFDSKGLADVYTGLSQLKLVSWSFNPTDTLTSIYANTIVSMMKGGVRFLITGCFPMTTLFDEYYVHPLFTFLGVTVDESNKHNFGYNFTFNSVSGEEDFKGFTLPWKMNEETDSLTQPLKITNSGIASPILKIAGGNLVMATKSQTTKSRAVIVHFNPYSITSGTDRNKFYDKCFDWLEAKGALGPLVTLSDTSIAFGEVKAGKFGEVLLKIYSIGDSALKITKMEISGTDKSQFVIFKGGITNEISVAPGDSHTVTLRLNIPANLFNSRDYSAALKITTSARTNPVQSLNLEGRGIGTNGVEDGTGNAISVKIIPNPVNDRSVVTFEMNGLPAEVEAILVDASGRAIETIHKGLMESGTTIRNFNAAALPSGFYFLIVRSPYGNLNIPVAVKK